MDESTNENINEYQDVPEEQEYAEAGQEDAVEGADEVQDGSLPALPQALADLRIKRYLAAGLVFLVVLGFAIATKQWKMLGLTIFTVWFAYNAYKVDSDWNSGNIVEEVVVCTSVRKSAVKDSVTVGFRTDTEIPSFFQFKVAGKRHVDDFIPNAVYIVYYEKAAPTQLLAYVAV